MLVDRRREDRTLTALEKLVDQMAAMREARTVALVITEAGAFSIVTLRLTDESAYWRAAPGRLSGGRGHDWRSDRQCGREPRRKARVDELIRLSASTMHRV